MDRRAADQSPLRSALLAATLAYAVGVLLVGGRPAQVGALMIAYGRVFAGVWLFVGAVLLAWRMVRDQRGEGRSGRRIALDFVRAHWSADRGASFIVPPLVLTVLMASFAYFKQKLLPAAGFWAEPLFADGERFVFGADPWAWSHFLLPSPWATKALDLAYHVWFLPMVLGVALCSFARPGSALVNRYLLSYALLWIVQGTAVATLLPAAGPVYHHLFQVDREHFLPLVELLARQDAWLRAHGAGGLAAVGFQAQLLTLRELGEPALGGGISAMPSLHNALAALFACAGYAIDRRLGRALAAFAAVILLGSVHLGWHYLSDGVAAIAMTVATWRAVGWLGAREAVGARWSTRPWPHGLVSVLTRRKRRGEAAPSVLA